ncbi:MAG: hypothetical protein V4534_00845 [Myxococcota bacterium]
MRLFAFVTIPILFIACAGNLADGIDVSVCTTQGQSDGQGHVCLGGTWKALLDGMCGTNTNGNIDGCAKGKVCTNNVCTFQPSASPVWFMTDGIESGATLNSSSNTQDYIYNILAKGYDSLDDFCATQAQQSIYPAMRMQRKWYALINAQGTAQNSRMALLSTYPTFLAPNGQSTAGVTPSVYDKNGINNLLPAFTGYFWSGMLATQNANYYLDPSCQVNGVSWAATSGQANTCYSTGGLLDCGNPSQCGQTIGLACVDRAP